MSPSSSLLSPAEEHFCLQYCAFLNSQQDPQQHEDLVKAFLAHVDYPHDWSINEAERNKASQRFFSLTKDLPSAQRPSDQRPPRFIFNMFNFKRLCYFLALGFATSMWMRYNGVQAAPSAEVAEIIRSVPSEELFFKGQQYDNATGRPFDLYTFDDAVDHSSAFEMYQSGRDSESLVKRDWYNCRFPNTNYIQKFCCSTSHAIGGFVTAVGSTAAGISLEKLLRDALDGKRDNQKPRSICVAKNGNNMCVSWASYSTEDATAAEEKDIAKYAIQCAQSGGSSEFKANTDNGGILFICVSNRADGCAKQGETWTT